MTAGPDTPAAFAARPLFEPIAALLARFTAPALPDALQLTALIREVAPAAASGSGQPIRFVPPPAQGHAYEDHIFTTGAVPTRAYDWHDFFNALAWCVWPRTKAACNILHRREREARIAAGLPGRGLRRDALTQFDECGIVVVSSDPEIPASLAAHAWEEAFWTRRAHLIQTTRFIVLGHGTWDQLREPFFGLCGKALYRVVDAGWLARPAAERQAETDAWLAAQLLDSGLLRTPRELAPLPLLGIPGITPENECASYYRDTRQFRPKRVPANKIPAD
ncbi:DUF3025 domain-containing protein [Aromatoleum petrolei]|uniref:DUF3025 domain-containing protein n=1 Tax=Aromatoleum petrolei TaxID=76116 RepID=A0ABX1MWE9_9RHOO|nr:DUF3025 domain-containing protein [Aromatoleum petrolei]NMF90675.1 DUF3025 domain-containing protein [Aromatoleum petrolei]QTQ38781.1 putative protein DUF3025 [Aromatoleum petrolei]